MGAKKSTPSRKAQFLKAYAECGNVTAAAAAAGIGKDMHYRALKTDPEYVAAFQSMEDRIGQELEDLAVVRVREGFKRQLFYQGKPIKTRNGHLVYETEYDTQLHITLLKRFRPKLYRDHVLQEHTGNINLVERLEAARARLVAIKRDEDNKTG